MEVDFFEVKHSLRGRSQIFCTSYLGLTGTPGEANPTTAHQVTWWKISHGKYGFPSKILIKVKQTKQTRKQTA